MFVLQSRSRKQRKLFVIVIVRLQTITNVRDRLRNEHENIMFAQAYYEVQLYIVGG